MEETEVTYNLEDAKVNKDKVHLEETEHEPVNKYNLMKGTKRIFFKKTRDFLRSKFSLMIGIITYEGDIKFYLVKPKDGKIVIDKTLYIVKDDNVIKSNLKYNMIFFNEDNPLSRQFSHIKNQSCSAKQLKKFLDSELLGMVLRSHKEKKLSMVFWVIIILSGIVVLVFGLLMATGVIDTKNLL